MNGGQAEFEEFYRGSYRQLLGLIVIAAGGQLHDAQEALDGAMLEALERWDEVRRPYGFVRIAAIHRLIKEKKRIRREFNPIDADNVESSHITGQQEWEQQRSVMEVITSLPQAQRETLACVFDGFGPAEIALLLVGNAAAVRQNLRLARRRLRMNPAETNGAEITATGHGEEAR